MNIAIILAGGIGVRFGADIPKQFVEVMGKPILAYTIDVFENHPEIDAIEIVCIESYLDYINDFIKKYNFTKAKWIAKGGKSFQESVLNGITNLENDCTGEDIVLVHFGVSPFVDDDIISDAIKVCNKKGNAISTTPFYILSGIKDNDEKSSTWIDRDTIACMNSPHAFKYGYIKQLYADAIESGIIDTVEPHTTTLMYKMGKTIYFSKGKQSNIKITTKDDLDLFEGYLLMLESKRQHNSGPPC